jgi:5-methylcytosine-specific restriction protein A
VPHAALKPCSYPGCSELVRYGRCSKHKTAQPQRDLQVHRLYDRKWKARRRAHLAEHPWCEDCLEQNLYTEATDVHHENRHRGDAETFLSSPLRSLCHSCHSRRTAAETREGG